MTAPVQEPAAAAVDPVTAPAAGTRALARGALVYGAGLVLARVVSFLLLPLYTRLLTPADYGLLQLLQMAVDVTALVVSAGTTAGVLRFYFKAPTEEERRSVVFTAFALLAALNGVGAVALVIAAPWLAPFVAPGPETVSLLRLTALGLLLEAAMVVPLLYAQARERAGLFVAASLARVVLQLTGNLVTLVVLGWGVRGMVVSNLVSTLVAGGLLAAWMLRETGTRFSLAHARDLRRFGIPYQFVTAGTFILSFGDRYVLNAWHGAAMVGLYALAYQFGMIYDQFGSLPLWRAWHPQRFRLADAPQAVRDAEENAGFLRFGVVCLAVAAGVALFARPVIAIMTTPAFHGAADAVPLLVAALPVQSYTGVVSLGIDIAERTRYATWGTWTAVALVIPLNILLVPSFGGVGSAAALLVSYLARFALQYYWSFRLWPVHYRWTPHLRGIAAAVAVVAVATTFRDAGVLVQVAVAVPLYLGFAAFLWRFGLDDDLRRAARALAAAGTRRIIPRAAAA